MLDVVEVVKGGLFCWYVVGHAECVAEHAPSCAAYGVLELLHVALSVQVGVRDTAWIVDADDAP